MENLYCITNQYHLVGDWNMNGLFFHWECHPNWRTHILQRGRLNHQPDMFAVWLQCPCNMVCTMHFGWLSIIYHNGNATTRTSGSKCMYIYIYIIHICVCVWKWWYPSIKGTFCILTRKSTTKQCIFGAPCHLFQTNPCPICHISSPNTLENSPYVIYG